MRKKILLICITLISIIFVLSGCGSSKPSEKKILEDLRLNSEATQWDEQLFDITDCKIVTYSPNGEYACIYECNVTKNNEEYEIVANSTIEYLKSENGWTLSDYKENSIEVTPLSGISDDDVISTVKNKFAGDGVTVTNIKHNFNKDAKTDTVTADFTYEQPYYNKSGSVNINAYFDKTSWNTTDSTENSQENWNLQPLVGTWQFANGNHLIQYKILSIDETTSTVSFQMRYTSHGTFWGDGSKRINEKPFSEIYQGKYVKSEKKNGEHIFVCCAKFYDGNFDYDYGLYVDKDSVYNYDDFYRREYPATKID